MTRKAFSVSAYATHEGRVLLVNHVKQQAWVPLGGEIEPNESPIEALERELREEAGWEKHRDYEVTSMILFEEHEAGPKGIHMNFNFLVKAKAPSLNPNEEFAAYAWVESETDLDPMPDNVRGITRRILRDAGPKEMGSSVEKVTPTQILEANTATQAHINLVRVLLRVAATEILMRGEVHDQSKFSPEEVEMFAIYSPKLKGMTYGSDEYKQCLKEMGPGLSHHYANNRHHPEWHQQGIKGMNLIDILEMFLDWTASSKRHADGDIRRSIEINQKRFGMSDDLAAIFHNTVPLFESPK